MSALKSYKLSELGFVGRGRSRHRPRDEPSLYGGAYPFFQTGDVKGAELYLTEYSQTYSEKGLAQSKLWEPGTLCITIAANIADTAILGVRGCFPDSVVGFVADSSKADVRYVKYYIDTLQARMQGVSRGTTQDNLSLEKLLAFELLAPPLEEQRRIAGVLGEYDDLIENNLRRVRILEEMARALHREWFVNFRFPGGTQTQLVETSVGKVPNGWSVKKLGEVIVLNYGRALKEANRRGGDVLVFGSSGVVGFHDVPLVKGPGLVVGRKGNVGSVFWSDRDFYPIDTAYYVTSSLPLRFLYFDLQTKNFLNSDAAVPGLSRRQAYSLETVVPSAEVVAAFCRIANAFADGAATLQLQVDNLRLTRDLLLPRLLSGQLRLAEIEAVPEQASASPAVKDQAIVA